MCVTHTKPPLLIFFQKPLIQHLKDLFRYIRHIIYFSDGCAGQYKNEKKFLNFCLHNPESDMTGEWHFFTTSRGKGPSDGIGGTVKREQQNQA